MAFITWLTTPDNNAATASLAATSTASGFPVANMQILPITNKWRSTSTAIQDIDIDFGSAKSIDLIALVNHNLSNGTAIQVFAGTTSAVSDFSSAMTWRKFTAFVRLSAQQSFRFWKVRINDMSNSSGYVEVGYLMLGASATPTFSFKYGWTSAAQYFSQEIPSNYGVPNIASMFFKQRLSLEFGPLTPANMTVLRTMYNTVKKDTFPLLLLPERDGADAYFGRIQADFDEKQETPYAYTTIAFEEDGYGRLT